VIEARRIPCSRRVAKGTRGREPAADVSRIGGSGKVCLVAGVAIRRRSCEHIVDVAAGARYRRMCSGQRERRVVVIKDRSRPRRRCVAGCAGGWEARRHVIWIGGSCKVCLVAGVAIRRGPREHVVDMAASAGDGSMCAS